MYEPSKQDEILPPLADTISIPAPQTRAKSMKRDRYKMNTKQNFLLKNN